MWTAIWICVKRKKKSREHQKYCRASGRVVGSYNCPGGGRLQIYLFCSSGNVNVRRLRLWQRENFFPELGPTVQGYSVSESVETLKLIFNNVAERLLQDFLGHYPKGRNQRCMEGIIMSFSRLGILVMTVVYLSVKKENIGENRRKEYADTFGKTWKMARSNELGMLGNFTKLGLWKRSN